MKRSLIRTCIPGLDELIEGGFTEGQNILVSGTCGTGKTTLAMQYVYRGTTTYKDPGVFVTLERGREKIRQDMARFGWDLKDVEKKGRFQLIGGPIITLQKVMERTGATINDLAAEIAEVVDEVGAKRAAIDSLSLFSELSRDEYATREAVMELERSLSKLGCTTVLTSRREPEKAGAEDGVIALYYDRAGVNRNRLIEVRKMWGVQHARGLYPMEIIGGWLKVYENQRQLMAWIRKTRGRIKARIREKEE